MGMLCRIVFLLGFARMQKDLVVDIIFDVIRFGILKERMKVIVK